MRGVFCREIRIAAGLLLLLGYFCQAARPGRTTGPDEPDLVRQKLRPGEVMLVYTVTDSMILINAIGPDSNCLVSQSLNSLFWESLPAFRKKLRSADPNEFSILGQVLYLYLVKPVKPFLEGKNRLIIIPGETLSGLPFEALVVADDAGPPYNICHIHYLVRDYEIVYHCSPGLWLQTAGTAGTSRDVSPDDHQFAFMGFSPVTGPDGRSGASLPASGLEIAEIGSLFRRSGMTRWLVSGPYSEKEYFKSVAGRGRIVHLATHYFRDPEEPECGGFLFHGSDPAGRPGPEDENILTVREITGLRLSADMVVLNACATGAEQVRCDDDPKTVPCLFATAGARNVLATLWNVNDRVAGAFMVCFYHRWLSGDTYAGALRDVKLLLMQNPETALPTIWAPYVLTGR